MGEYMINKRFEQKCLGAGKMTVKHAKQFLWN